MLTRSLRILSAAVLTVPIFLISSPVHAYSSPSSSVEMKKLTPEKKAIQTIGYMVGTMFIGQSTGGYVAKSNGIFTVIDGAGGETSFTQGMFKNIVVTVNGKQVADGKRKPLTGDSRFCVSLPVRGKYARYDTSSNANTIENRGCYAGFPAKPYSPPADIEALSQRTFDMLKGIRFERSGYVTLNSSGGVNYYMKKTCLNIPSEDGTSTGECSESLPDDSTVPKKTFAGPFAPTMTINGVFVVAGVYAPTRGLKNEALAWCYAIPLPGGQYYRGLSQRLTPTAPSFANVRYVIELSSTGCEEGVTDWGLKPY